MSEIPSAPDIRLGQIQLAILRPLDRIPSIIRRCLPEFVKNDIVLEFEIRDTLGKRGKKFGQEIARIGGLKDHEAEVVAAGFQNGLFLHANKEFIHNLVISQRVQDGRDLSEQFKELDVAQLAEVVAHSSRREEIKELGEVIKDAHMTSIDKKQFLAWEKALSETGARLAMYVTFSENRPPTLQGIKNILTNVEENRPVTGSDFTTLNALLRTSGVKAFRQRQKYNTAM